MSKLHRNEPCHCGSGKKYKNCHLDADEKLARQERASAAAVAAADEMPPVDENGQLSRLLKKSPVASPAGRGHLRRCRKSSIILSITCGPAPCICPRRARRMLGPTFQQPARRGRRPGALR
jgi:hypothetical protein